MITAGILQFHCLANRCLWCLEVNKQLERVNEWFPAGSIESFYVRCRCCATSLASNWFQEIINESCASAATCHRWKRKWSLVSQSLTEPTVVLRHLQIGVFVLTGPASLVSHPGQRTHCTGGKPRIDPNSSESLFAGALGHTRHGILRERGALQNKSRQLMCSTRGRGCKESAIDSTPAWVDDRDDANKRRYVPARSTTCSNGARCRSRRAHRAQRIYNKIEVACRRVFQVLTAIRSRYH